MGKINYADMVGTRGQANAYPIVSIAGRSFERPVSTCNLGYGKFCVLDNALSTQDRDEILETLRAYVAPKSKTKAKQEEVDTDETP